MTLDLTGKIILVDMDDTIADSEKQIKNIWKWLNYDAIEPYPQDKTTYKKDMQLSQTGKQLLEEAVCHPDFYRTMEIIEGSVEALYEMQSLGADVYFCTRPKTSSSHCYEGKKEWIREHFGDKWVKKFIPIKDKTMVIGDYLIDDKPVIPNAHKATWKQIYFDQPYNRANTTIPRITSWNNWKEVFSKGI